MSEPRRLDLNSCIDPLIELWTREPQIEALRVHELGTSRFLIAASFSFSFFFFFFVHDKPAILSGWKGRCREGVKKGKSLCASLPPHHSKGEMSLSKGGECFLFAFIFTPPLLFKTAFHQKKQHGSGSARYV